MLTVAMVNTLGTRVHADNLTPPVIDNGHRRALASDSSPLNIYTLHLISSSRRQSTRSSSAKNARHYGALSLAVGARSRSVG